LSHADRNGLRQTRHVERFAIWVCVESGAFELADDFVAVTVVQFFGSSL